MARIELDDDDGSDKFSLSAFYDNSVSFQLARISILLPEHEREIEREEKERERERERIEKRAFLDKQTSALSVTKHSLQVSKSRLL
jgi:hypothetical protein